VVDKDEDISCLENHSQSLIPQIKKLEIERRCNKKKLEQIINKDFKIDKETMVDLVELRISLDIEIQKIEIETLTNPCVATNKNLVINRGTQVCEEDITPKVNRENSKIMRGRDHVTSTHYRHPNW